MKKLLFAIVTLVFVAGFSFSMLGCADIKAVAERLPTENCQLSTVNSKIVIVLDAGHGGADGGVTGVTSGAKESDINLSIVKKLKTSLEKTGYKIVLTRDGEGGACSGGKKSDMQKRKEIIEEAAPTLVVSIHCNKFPDKSRRGAQVFFQQTSKNGKELANNIQLSLNELNAKHNGRTFAALKGDYFIINCNAHPSVIVECGFLSNPQDDNLLNSDGYQLQVVEKIHAGIVNYLMKNE
jgi:N-acetylmuramoyl-L-alanine amidase